MNKITIHSDSVWDWSPHSEFQAPYKEAWQWLNNKDGEVHIFEDNWLTRHEQFNCKVKIASLLECPEVYAYYKRSNPSVLNPFDWIKENHRHFDYIMSPYYFLKDLVGDKFLWVPALSSRIKRDEFGLYEKERNVSIIASFKDWTYGHKLRHEIIKKYGNQFDIYGSGYNNLINTHGKIIAVAPYRFNICVLNSCEDDYFTEHLTDVFAVGTVPVWFGTKNLKKYWNPDGFIQFESLNDLEQILPTLTPELYQSKLDAITENVEITKKYVSIPDFIYENYKTLLESI